MNVHRTSGNIPYLRSHYTPRSFNKPEIKPKKMSGPGHFDISSSNDVNDISLSNAHDEPPQLRRSGDLQGFVNLCKSLKCHDEKLEKCYIKQQHNTTLSFDEDILLEKFGDRYCERRGLWKRSLPVLALASIFSALTGASNAHAQNIQTNAAIQELKQATRLEGLSAARLREAQLKFQHQFLGSHVPVTTAEEAYKKAQARTIQAKSRLEQMYKP